MVTLRTIVVNGNGASGITFGVGGIGAAATPMACTRESSPIAASRTEGRASSAPTEPPNTANNSSLVCGFVLSVRNTESAASSSAKIAALGTRYTNGFPAASKR